MNKEREGTVIPQADLDYFAAYRKELFFPDTYYETPAKKIVPIIYVDATAMGSPMKSIEDRMLEILAREDESYIDERYHETLAELARYTNAGTDYEFIPIGSGCTGAMNLLFRDILCLRLPDYLQTPEIMSKIPQAVRPIFITTLMEHHSTDLTLRECYGERIIHIGFDNRGLPDLKEMETRLKAFADEGNRSVYVVCSGGSNVTGIQPDLHAIGELAHKYNAFFAVDMAAAGPYTKLDLKAMPAEAVGLSVHKFPGGPQTCGLLVVKKSIFCNCGWTPPEPRISSKLELIRAGLVFQIKASMDIERIRRVVAFYSQFALERLQRNELIEILGHKDVSRFAIISFLVQAAFDPDSLPPQELQQFILSRPKPAGGMIHYVHHNFIARLLSDIYGAQVRPGCSCAGAYGHWLLQIDPGLSQYHRDRIDQGLMDKKPGWVRVTFNELNTLADVETVLNAIDELSHHWMEYAGNYYQNQQTGEFLVRTGRLAEIAITDWHDFHQSPRSGYSPAIERFIRTTILPNAANTHTETSFTGTISTQWYHWACDTIKRSVGADESFALKFIRAGYCPYRLLIYYLGGACPERLDRFYGLTDSLPLAAKPVFLVWSKHLPPNPYTFGSLVQVASVEQLLAEAVRFHGRPIHAFVAPDIVSNLSELTALLGRIRPLVSSLILLANDLLGRITLDAQTLALDGLVMETTNLPGGWHGYPVLLLKQTLFVNRLPFDVGGGVVHWTTEQSQRYVEDRTALEDAGTPGIIQGIRTGLVIGALAAE